MESKFVPIFGNKCRVCHAKATFLDPLLAIVAQSNEGCSYTIKKTGIFPVNRRMIKDSDLGPSATTDNTVNLQGKMYSEMVVYYVCVVLIFAISPVILFWK